MDIPFAVFTLRAVHGVVKIYELEMLYCMSQIDFSISYLSLFSFSFIFSLKAQTQTTKRTFALRNALVVCSIINLFVFLLWSVCPCCTVCPGSSDPPEKEVYTIYQLLRYFRLNIICLQSK